MELYYILDTDKCKAKKEDIGEIITEIGEKYGVYFGVCPFGKEAMNLWCKQQMQQGVSVLNEQVLSYKLNRSEKKTVLINFLKQLGVKENELYVIDRFIFTKNEKDYDFLEDVLDSVSPSKITFITKNEPNENIIQRMKTKFNYQILKTHNVHDRFWIVPYTKKGILVGTSLNGFEKMFVIKELDPQEVQIILEDLIEDLEIHFDIDEEAHHVKENKIPAANER